MPGPEPIEWPPDLHGAPHGTPFLVRRKPQAALKHGDGSVFAPAPRSHLWLLHVVVADDSDLQIDAIRDLAPVASLSGS